MLGEELRKETSLKSLLGTGSGQGRRRQGEGRICSWLPTLSMSVCVPLDHLSFSHFDQNSLLHLNVLLMSFSLAGQRPPLLVLASILVLTPFSRPPSLLGIWPEKGQEDPLSQLSQSFPATLQATASQPLYLGIRV